MVVLLAHAALCTSGIFGPPARRRRAGQPSPANARPLLGDRLRLASKSVTYVSGMNCYPSVRKGNFLNRNGFSASPADHWRRPGPKSRPSASRYRVGLRVARLRRCLVVQASYLRDSPGSTRESYADSSCLLAQGENHAAQPSNRHRAGRNPASSHFNFCACSSG